MGHVFLCRTSPVGRGQEEKAEVREAITHAHEMVPDQ